MGNISEKANRAERLRTDEAFKEFVAEVRADAFSRFERSGPKDTEAREEAHAMLRALAAIEGRLTAAINNNRVEQKKGQHRGSD